MNPALDMTLAEKWSETLMAAGYSSGPAWLQAMKRNAAEQFRDCGLPDRKVEAWKYTPMSVLERLDPRLDTGSADRGHSATFTEPVCEASAVVDISNGVLAGDLPDTADGLTLLPLAEGIATFEDRLRPLIEGVDIEGPGRAFAALNTAMLQQGLLVHVAENTVAGALLIRWALSGNEVPSLSQFRLVVLLEAGAQLHLTEQFQSEAAAGSALNVILQAELSDRAGLDHVRVQNESDDTVLLTSTSVSQASESRYVYLGFDLGGRLVRHELNVKLGGREASADLGGAFVLDGKRYADNHVSVEHAAGDCSSRQFYRGVLGGSSRGVFNGRALIQAGADGSAVQQSNANLLLSELAEMDTKPELEIYADEVEASHGATVGQLDESAIFYLRSRGLSDSEARRMLTAAFCRAVTDRLTDRALAERIASLVDAAMPGRLPEEGD